MVLINKNTRRTTPPLTISGSMDSLSPPITRHTPSEENLSTLPCRTSSVESYSSKHTLPFMCPLCLTHPIQCPVRLHPVRVESPGTRAVCLACRACVSRWREMAGEALVQCPQCSVPISSGTPLKNRDIIKFLDERDVVVNCSAVSSTEGSVPGILSQESALCGICEENTSQEYCLPCGFPLCSLCQESSHKRGRYRTHEVVPLHSARTRSSRHCPEHTAQMLDLYCFTCRMCVCLSCCFGGKHKGHTVEPLADVAATTRSQLNAEMTRLEPVADAASDLATNFEEQLTKYESEICNAQRSIQEYFDALRKDLKEREEGLQREILDEASRVKGTVFRFISQCRAAQTSFQQVSAVLDEFLHIGDNADIVRCENVMRQNIRTLSSAIRGAHNSGRVALQRMETALEQNGGIVVLLGGNELTEVISRTCRLEHLDVFGIRKKDSVDTILDTNLSPLQSVPQPELGLQESDDNIHLSIPPRAPSDEQLRANSWTSRHKSTERLSLHIGARATTPHPVLENDIPSSGTESRVMFYRLSTRKRFLRAGSEEHNDASPPLGKQRLSSALTGLPGLFFQTRGTSRTLDKTMGDANTNDNLAAPTSFFTSSSVQTLGDVPVPKEKESGNAHLHLQLRL